MKKNEILLKMQDIFREIFEDNSLVVTEETSADDIDEWDSFNNISLITSIEKAFNIQFNLSELQDLENVGAMVDLMINEKL